MFPLVTETAGLDPLILFLLTTIATGAGFVARQWIKDRDYERAQCAAMQKKLDDFQERAYRVAALVNEQIGHTEDDTRAHTQPTRTRARKRPRGPGNA